MLRLRQTTLIGALGVAIAAGAALTPSRAQAAPYRVSACGDGGGSFNRLWVRGNTAPDVLDMSQNCPANGRQSGLLIQDATGGGLVTPGGARAEWVFAAPPGTSVSGIEYSRWMAAIGSTGWLVYLRDGAGNLLESCSPATGPVSCEIGTPGEVGKPTAARTSFGGLSTSGLAVGVTCTNPGGCTNSSDSSFHNAGASIQGATISLEDPSPPQIGSALAGPLTDTQSVLAGIQTLTVSASDQGGGVARIALNAFASNQVASLPLGCDFTRAAPCPAATTQTLSLDTGTLPDGLVSLSVVVEDAAGNRSTSGSWSVRVDNTPPSISRFTTFPDAVRVGQPFELKWDTANEGFAPSAEARWRLVAPDGKTAREGTERASPTLGPRSVSGLVLGSPGTWRVEVTLIDQLGRAGPLATDSLAPRPAAGGTATRGSDPRVRLTKTQALARVAPAARSRRFAARVLVSGRVAGAWKRTVAARRTTLIVPLPRPARRAARFRVEWRAPGKGWQRALVVRPSA